MGPRLRFATHREVSRVQVERELLVMSEILR